MKNTKQIRKSVVLLMGLLCGSTALAQQPFVVEGDIEGLPDGTSFMLFEMDGNSGMSVDGNASRDGHFRLQGTASGRQFKLTLTNQLSGMHTLDLWGQSGDTATIKGTSKYSFDWVVSSTNPLQAEQSAYDMAAKEVFQAIARQDTLLRRLEVRQRMVPKEQAQAVKDSVKMAEARRDSLYAQARAKQFAVLEQRYLRNGEVEPLSPCGEYILSRIAGSARAELGFPCLDEIRSFYMLIPKEGRQSHAMRVVEAGLFPSQTRVKAGDMMYDGVVLCDLQGDKHRLSDYKGKYLLLDFWGSNCSACLGAIPVLKEISEELKDSLTIISISSDDDESWSETSKVWGITWVNLNDKRGHAGIFSNYNIRMYPSYVLVSPEGRILKTFFGEDIRQELSDVFPQYKNRVVRHPFAIQGHVGDMSDGSVVTLLSEQGGAMVKVATDTIRGGFFYLEGIDERNHQYELQVARNGEGGGVVWRGLWIQPGDNVVIQGDGQYLKAWDIRSDNPLQAEQAVYDKAALDEAVKVEMLNMQMHAVGARFNKAAPDEIPALRDSMIFLDRRKDALEDEAMARQFLAMKQYYMAGDTIAPLTPCGESLLKSIAYAVRYVKDFPVAEDVRAFYKQLPESYRQTAVGENIGAMLFPPEVVKQGDRMYDGAVLYDLQGGQHRLSDYNKGKYLLLDFWGSGCGPCLAAFPELKEVSEELKDSLVVISLSQDSKYYWEQASAQHQITWVNLNDFRERAGIFAHYGVVGIPHYAIISPEGKIVKTFTGYSKGRIKQKLSGIFPQYKKKD